MRARTVFVFLVACGHGGGFDPDDAGLDAEAGVFAQDASDSSVIDPDSACAAIKQVVDPTPLPVDIIWLVAPNFEHHGFPFSWMDVAIPVGLAGIWVFLFVRQLRSRPLLPLNDPFFKEAFAHEAH